MIQLDEDALICDFAETYQVYDYRGLPASYAAALAAGLRANSRIRMKMAGISVEPETIMTASILDTVNTIAWMKTKDGEKNRNRPKSIVLILTQEQKENNVEGFTSVESFEEARRRLLKGK